MHAHAHTRHAHSPTRSLRTDYSALLPSSLLRSGGEATEEAALWLIERGADVRSRTFWGTTCLAAACRSSTVAVCQTLVVHGAAPDLDLGALRAAVCHDRDVICQWLCLLGVVPALDDFATPRSAEKRRLLDRLV